MPNLRSVKFFAGDGRDARKNSDDRTDIQGGSEDDDNDMDDDDNDEDSETKKRKYIVN